MRLPLRPEFTAFGALALLRRHRLRTGRPCHRGGVQLPHRPLFRGGGDRLRGGQSRHRHPDRGRALGRSASEADHRHLRRRQRRPLDHRHALAARFRGRRHRGAPRRLHGRRVPRPLLPGLPLALDDGRNDLRPARRGLCARDVLQRGPLRAGRHRDPARDLGRAQGRGGGDQRARRRHPRLRPSGQRGRDGRLFQLRVLVLWWPACRGGRDLRSRHPGGL